MSQKIVPLFAVLAALASMPASAQDCDAVVYDGINVLVGRGVQQVETAVASLKEATGADLRVRILASHPNLPAAIGEMRAQCASWWDPNGGRRGNLLVLAFAMKERKSELDFGGDWTDAIGGKWPSIQNAVVTPRFRSGDIAGGIAAGIASVQQRIVAYQAPPAPAPAPVVVHTEPAKPMDLSWLGAVLKWLLALAAFVASVLGLKELFREAERRSANRDLAIIAKQAADDLLLEVKNLGYRAAALRGEVSAQVHASELSDADAVLAKAEELFSGAVGDYNILMGGINNPYPRLRSVERYQRIARLYQDVSAKFRMAEREYKAAMTEAGIVQKTVTQAPEVIEAAGDIRKQSLARIAAVNAQGYRTDLQDQRMKGYVTMVLRLADEAAAERKFGAALKQAERAIDAAGDSAKEAEDIVLRAKALTARADSLQAAVETLWLKGVEARKVFDELERDYSPEAWESVKGNGTEAVNRCTLAAESIGATRAKLDLAVQDWVGAADLLDKAAKAVERGSSYLNSIFTMSAALSNAKDDALPDVQSAEEALAKSEAINKEYDADVEDAVWPSIKEAKQQLHDARNLLQHTKPNYFRVIKLARAALKAAEETLRAANAEHEAAEVKRTRAAQALRDAKSRVATAKEYIDDRRSKVKAKNKKKLEEAEEELKRAEASGDTDFIIVTAESSEASAKGAYEGARSDVSSASWTSPSSGGSTGSSWGSSWDSGGSSSGSFDFGGGGGSDGGSW